VKGDKVIRVAHYGQKHANSHEGGVEVVVGELAKRQVQMGYEVTCYNRTGHHISGAEHDIPQVTEWNGVHMKYVPTIEKKGIAAVSSSFCAAVCCAFGPYDVVHVHAEGPWAFCWIPRLFGKKIVAHNHGIDYLREKWDQGFGAGRRFIRHGERVGVRKAHALIVLSRALQEYFSREYGRETILVPNGINRPEVLPADYIRKEYGLEKDNYILFLARATSEKRPELLIDAYKKVKTDKKLVIAGGASDSADYVEMLRKKAGDDPHIIFTGYVDGVEKAELYSNAYVYVLPSDLEGMAICLLEAMSYGNCCLVSDIPENTTVVGEHACTFKQGDLASLTNELQRLCDDEAVVAKYKVNAADYICKAFSWDKTTEQIADIYEQLLRE